MIVIDVIPGQVICEEGMPFTHIYFVKSGNYAVTKRIKMPGLLVQGDEPVNNLKIALKS
jgi:hypothetical protein